MIKLCCHACLLAYPLLSFFSMSTQSLSLLGLLLSHIFVVLRRTNKNYLSQPANRVGGLQVLRLVAWSPGLEWATQWCILNLSRDVIWDAPPSHWETLCASLDFLDLCISSVMWCLESLHGSHVPSPPRFDSIWQEQALQLNTTNPWLKCMIMLSVILLLPNFCQRAFLGKLSSQLGLESRQLVMDM